jgi:aconitate hydratase
VQRAKEVQAIEEQRQAGKAASETEALLKRIREIPGCEAVSVPDFGIGSAIFARKPGDGSAREQAASCQRVLGAAANFALEYATKRYRSNLINWGMLPFIIDDEKILNNGAYIFIPGIKKAIHDGAEKISGFVLGEHITEISASPGELSAVEREILIKGCLINYYAATAG